MRISRNCAGLKLYRNRHWINASHRFSRDCSNADCVSQNRDNFRAEYSVAPLFLYDEVLLQSTVITFRRAAATRSSSQCYLCNVSLSSTVKEGSILLRLCRQDAYRRACVGCFLRLLFCVISMQTSNNVVTATSVLTHILRISAWLHTL